jgi:diguanylate cyclase (GGDEF)-like protein
MLMLAGVRQAVQATTSERAAAPPLWQSRLLQALRTGLPYAWLGGAYLVLALEPYSPGGLRHDLLFGWGGLIIGLVILRQIAAFSENQQLAAALAQLNRELEQRVMRRTQALTRANDELRREMSERERVEHLLREREEKLAHDALHDVLTGLPNRLLLADHLAQAIHRRQRHAGYQYALLFLDLDGFKDVNDAQGHLTGDQALVEIAGRLRAAVREIDTVARLGGDEFVILVEDAGGQEEAGQVAARIQAVLAEPVQVGNQRVFLSASIGVVAGDQAYQQPDDVLRDADLAMYAAKAQGKARSVLFTPQLREHALDRLGLERDLRLALERGEFRLHYQPILALDTNQITGFEALIRWQHPERGCIAPGDFIPLAETSGLIGPITSWVLQEACRQMRAWQLQSPGYAGLSISVNLSPRLFTQPELPQMVAGALAASGLRPEHLRLEITESIIVREAENTKKILDGWRRQGIQVHMDDFGTGYSSLSYLHKFPIDTLKIDRSFISLIQSRSDRSEIVRTIIALARDLNIKVIAEGVETAEQMEFLREMGCQSAQGFFISRPLTPEAAQALLLRSPAQAG